jgi:PIN domain nuclease of toxin-antitoxin system
LPWHHRDPFDRLLVAQSLEEGVPLMTSDDWVQDYELPIVW